MREIDKPVPHESWMEGDTVRRGAIMLWPGRPPASAPGSEFRPWLDPVLLKGTRRRGLVVVCPGGGYVARAKHEGRPIARMFNRMGLHAVVLHYRVKPNRHPAPLMDVARAVRIARHRAKAWHVDPKRVAVCGFSAGGHLAGSLGVLWRLAPAGVRDAISRQSCRPDAMVLCYAVISSGVCGHRGSFLNLLGPRPPRTLLAKMSLERQVRKDTPPAFLWTTVEDAAVPIENSTLFAQALRAHGVPFEIHVYPKGQHGLGLAPGDPHLATWPKLCAGFFRAIGFLGGRA
jgi:acetyl esterase/lipase